jgi:hypothetical protein
MEEREMTRDRSPPTSELDLNLMITDNVWGRPDVSPELKEVLNKYYIEQDENGNNVVKASSLWGLLSYYTRDIRLGNLSVWDGELRLCRYELDLAGQLLYAGMIEPFLVALSKAITIIETSQSKNGFLRRAMNTLRQEHFTQTAEVQKKSFFGGNKKDNGGDY